MPDALAKVTVAAAEEAPGARPFAVLGVVTCLALLVGVMAFNVAVNPRGDFPGQRFTPLVEDAPREKLRLYEEWGPASTILVGSSRTLPLPPDALAPDAFNFAIQAGSLLDDRLAYEAVLGRQPSAPAHLFVGLDSFQLIELPDRVWSEVLLSRAAPDYLQRSPSPTVYLGPLRDTLSSVYTKDSLHVLRLTYLEGYPTPATAFLPNGQGVRPGVDPLLAAGSYDFDAAFEQNWDRFLGAIYGPDVEAAASQQRALEGLVAEARAKGTQVDLVLLPFHDRALERLADNPVFGELQGAARATMDRLCQDGVRAFDYTDVAAFGGDPDGFYDGYHLTPANGATLLEGVRDGRGDRCDDQDDQTGSAGQA
jgi:hypothetical protein